MFQKLAFLFSIKSLQITCLLLACAIFVTNHPIAFAQDGDPIEEIESHIKKGKEELAKVKSRKYRGKRKKAVRIKIYFEALKSFSSALRKLNEYQIEDDQYFEQLEALFNEVSGIKEVSDQISKIDGKLMKALKKKDYENANQLAQQLLDLDERRDTIKYLLPIVSDLTTETQE